MKKTITESQLKEMISNKIFQILRENNEEMEAKLEAANRWFASLDAYDKYSVFTEDGGGSYDSFMEGLAEWYGNIGWQHLSPDEFEEYSDESWDYTPDDDKVRLYDEFKGYLGSDEDDLKNIVSECVKKTLAEWDNGQLPGLSKYPKVAGAQDEADTKPGGWGKDSPFGYRMRHDGGRDKIGKRTDLSHILDDIEKGDEQAAIKFGKIYQNNPEVKKAVYDALAHITFGHMRDYYKWNDREIAESVKKALNEISPDMLYRASDKAYTMGRNAQGNKFGAEADERMNQEYANDDILKVTNKKIVFRVEGSRVVLNNDGNYMINATSTQGQNESGSLLGMRRIPGYMKTENKALARKIAKWCSQYLIIDEPVRDVNDVRPNYDDWHTWCML